MSRFLSARAFMLFFGVGYAMAVIYNWPLFRYYPLVNMFSWTDIPSRELGPAMTWYGWITTALIIGLVGAVVIPKSLANRLWIGVFWLLPLAMLAAGYYREQEWFIK